MLIFLESLLAQLVLSQLFNFTWATGTTFRGWKGASVKYGDYCRYWEHDPVAVPPRWDKEPACADSLADAAGGHVD
jgi:hypothetical protein